MSGTSLAIPCRSPFATALATLHLLQICTVAPLTTSPPPLPAEASSHTFIRRPTRNSTVPKALKRSTLNVKYSSVYQFNLSVQRQLPYNITASAAYVGTLGRHLQTFVDANYAPYATVNALGATITPTTSSHRRGGTDERRQYDAGNGAASLGSLTGITELISDQTSNYNGLQISATKQMSRGFSVSGFYVWSRALESSNPVENGGMSAQDFGVLGKPFTPFNNIMGAVGGGLREEYGPMDQNHDSNAAISGMWDINYFHGSNRIVKEVVNGWTVSPVVYLISGGPFTVSAGSNKNFDIGTGNAPTSILAGRAPSSIHTAAVYAAPLARAQPAW